MTASVIPYYPFHGVPRFYDISGMTHNPEIFQLAIDVFVRRYASLDVDCIAGLDARGFVLGPPIALALKKPFVMVRKKGKLPNSVSGADYKKEYVAIPLTHTFSTFVPTDLLTFPTVKSFLDTKAIMPQVQTRCA